MSKMVNMNALPNRLFSVSISMEQKLTECCMPNITFNEYLFARIMRIKHYNQTF